FFRLSSRHVSDHERDRVAAGERRAAETVDMPGVGFGTATAVVEPGRRAAASAGTATAGRPAARNNRGFNARASATTAATPTAATTAAAATPAPTARRGSRRLPVGSVRRDLLAERRAGTTNERDALAVRRPHRRAVDVRAWRDEIHSSSFHIV